MAQRRMFSLKIVNSDAFLDMSVDARELYFQLGMNADDDGFVSPRKIMRMTGAPEDALKVLLAKRFILQFGTGVIVIKHWRTNNYIQKDRYDETKYKDLKETLFLNKNGDYTDNPEGNKPLVSKMYTQVRLGKVNISANAPLNANTRPETRTDGAKSVGELLAANRAILKEKGII